MGRFELGVVMPNMQFGPDRTTAHWPEIKALAGRAEDIGFDTIWIADELLWRMEDGAPRGCWDGISLAGAVAAATSKAKVGTWVLSALHRNPAIIAKTAETLDDISGGRFVFGLGAGHEWPGQAHAFGLPEDRIFARFEEALEIIVLLIRAGHANFEGEFHAARDLPQQPRGPRPGKMPLLIGGNGPKGQRAAVRHADIYSCYIEERAAVDEVAPRLASMEAICDELGRDPTSIGRSVGVSVRPLEPAGVRPDVVSGSAEEIADAFRSFRQARFTQLEIMFGPGTMEALDALAPVVEAIHAD
jgi:alkanesulfonate monooxygenase SsuD/methylene tetrahydromethanopterin reductase-like flavin-dependent oxidoreductase (luciferase family)